MPLPFRPSALSMLKSEWSFLIYSISDWTPITLWFPIPIGLCSGCMSAGMYVRSLVNCERTSQMWRVKGCAVQAKQCMCSDICLTHNSESQMTGSHKKMKAITRYVPNYFNLAMFPCVKLMSSGHTIRFSILI